MNKTSERKFVDVQTAKNARCLRCRNALTLLEMILALAILGIIFAAILPQFRVMFNSWDSKQASAEILQNGRVLIDHLNRNLQKAVTITAVSPSTDTLGYIEFLDTADKTLRYDVVPSSKYVEFGEVGNLDDLAGPVSSLQFTCYDACDLSTPITDVDEIRFVKVTAAFPTAAALGQSKTFTTETFIRTNYQGGDIGVTLSSAHDPWFEYDIQDSKAPALYRIDDAHYLCTYEGKDDDGWAVVLQVNPTGNVSKKVPFEFDIDRGMAPAMAKIDDTHYLCTYRGKDDDGWAVVLEVDSSSFNITQKIPFEFDTQECRTLALTQIDSTHYLCAYQGKDADGWAVVLTVVPGIWTIIGGVPFEFDTQDGQCPALAQIDSTHYLCTYRGKDDDGWAVVLEINPLLYTISKRASFEFDITWGINADLAKIDGSHYLCVYEGWNYLTAIILNIDSATWAISKLSSMVVSSEGYCSWPSLSWVSENRYVCSYSNATWKGKAVVFTVREDWSVDAGTPFMFDTSRGKESALARVDDTHCVCAYSGVQEDGWTGVLKLNNPPVFP